MREIYEAYRRIGDTDERFDIDFWQSQGDEAIFKAANIPSRVSRETSTCGLRLMRKTQRRCFQRCKTLEHR
jgi:hypothetical protein